MREGEREGRRKRRGRRGGREVAGRREAERGTECKCTEARKPPVRMRPGRNEGTHVCRQVLQIPPFTLKLLEGRNSRRTRTDGPVGERGPSLSPSPDPAPRQASASRVFWETDDDSSRARDSKQKH